MLSVQLRPELPQDYRAVEKLTYHAFSRLEKPGREVCDEHLLVHKMRSDPSFVPELDFVAVQGDKVVGNIMYTRSKVVDKSGAEHDTLTFGPLSVLPEAQGLGVGSQLVLHTLALAEIQGHSAVIILGHPSYYHRFGFVSADTFGLTLSDGTAFDAFMAVELKKGYLSATGGGKFYADPVYEISREELEIFNRTFLLTI